jgi:ribosomal protein S18 acetylase RimI-like enzyme
MLHPSHEQLVQTVRNWYTRSYPEMGYHVEERRFGLYSRNVHSPRGGQVRVRTLRPEDVPHLVADVRDYYGDTAVSICIDDRQLDAELGPALAAAGCSKGADETFLAHVGPPPRAPAVEGLEFVPVDESTVRDYVIAKRKGFASSEAPPDEGEVNDEVALRLAELRGGGWFLVGHLQGEAAGVIGWYEGHDRFVFQLATRVPFRRRGIARALLCHAIADAYARSCRSVIISGDAESAPVGLYRSLGFTDEVYWRRRYTCGR